jgi:hypothetical protein
MIQGIGAAGSRRVVARRLICKRGECKAVGVEQRWGEPPWLVVSARCGILVLDVFRITMSGSHVVSRVVHEGRVMGNGPVGAETKQHGALPRAHCGRASTQYYERYLPSGVCYIESICEGVAWRACDRVRALCKVRKAGLEVLQQLFVRLCL